MSKPLLLSGGQGKVQELVGTATGQTVVWSAGPDEWVLGTPSSSGGGGVTWYLNQNTTAGSPTTNLPTGASGAVVKNLSATADGASTTVASTSSVPVLPASPEIIAGFVTDATVPGLTGIPAGLWDFNVWAQASGNTTNQSYIQLKVYKYDGSTAPTFIAESVPVYLYDPGDVTQYTASVLIPAGISLLVTDRIYVEVVGGSTTSNRQITLHFGNGEPSHVHTTLLVPVNLATGVTGTLPAGNGGTGQSSYAVGDLLYASTMSALSRLADVATGNALISGGVGVAPSWGKIGLTTHVSGTLPVANGGTGLSSIASGSILYASSANTLSAGTLSSLSWTTINPATNIGLSPLFVSGGDGRTATLTGGFSGTGTAGQLTLTGGNSTSGTGGAALLRGGDGGTGTGGALDVRGGSGTTANGALTLGTTTTSSVTIGATGITTTLNGTVSLPTGAAGVTQSAGNNTTALATTAFVTTAVATSSGAPYDLPCEIPGTPPTSTKVVNFETVRPFILATMGHQGGQLTAPSGNFVCTVRKNATTIGTITFGTSSFSTNITGTLAERTFAAGDVLSVETQATDLGIDTPFWTFFMTLA